MKVTFPGLALVAALLFAVAFAAAPWFAFRAVRGAAVAGDVQALGQLIDYGAVRAGLRTQIQPSVAAQIPAPNVWSDPIGAMRHALQQPLLQQPPQVDALLTPAALARMTDGLPPAGPAPAAAPHPLPGYVYWDFGRARLGVSAPGRPAERTVFTFERTGLLQWRLVQIRLPGPAAPS